MEKKTVKKTANGLETKAFLLGASDIQNVKAVREEENLTSDSAALRQIIQDGMHFRQMKTNITSRVKDQMQKLITTEMHRELLRSIEGPNTKPTKTD